jgi:hypothetical protein
MSDDAPSVPDVVREFHDDLLADDAAAVELADTRVPVPVRFDRASPTAEWRFDGRLTARIRERDAE